MLTRLIVLCSFFVISFDSFAANTAWDHLSNKKHYVRNERMKTIFPTTPYGDEWIIPSTQTLSNSPSGGVNITNSSTVPVGGKNVPITTVKNASNAALAVAAGGVLRNAVRIGVPAVGALTTALAVKDLFDAANIKFYPDAPTADKALYQNVALPGFSQSDGYLYGNHMTEEWASSVAAAGQLAVNRLNLNNQASGLRFVVYATDATRYNIRIVGENGDNWYQAGKYPGKCPAGWYVLSNGQCVETANEKKPLTPEEIDNLIAQQQIKSDALQELINQDKAHKEKNGIRPFGYQTPTLDTSVPSASGPSSIPGSTSTTSKQTTVSQGTTQPTSPGTPGAQPATQTTTTTTVNNITYNQNTVTNNVVNTTTTTITNNVTNETSSPATETETTDKPDPEQEYPPVDTPFGPLPSLYERKYPDGLVGIWNQKSEIIKQSSAFTLASDLMPTALTAGTCPAWNINLDFTWWSSYGEHNVAPPCWIWDVAKGIIIISALMLARSLIFGG